MKCELWHETSITLVVIDVVIGLVVNATAIVLFIALSNQFVIVIIEVSFIVGGILWFG